MKRLIVATIVLFFPSFSHACAVCFGATDSNLAKGFTWGVAFLAILPFLLMIGLGTAIFRATKKHHSHE